MSPSQLTPIYLGRFVDNRRWPAASMLEGGASCWSVYVDGQQGKGNPSCYRLQASIGTGDKHPPFGRSRFV
jgi:hypothetical protein